MVRSRIAFNILIGMFVLLLGSTLLLYFSHEQAPAHNFPATVSRDCAPWDGTAFTISVQYDPGRTIIISIWQSPELPLRSTFSFPDESGQKGNAALAPALSSYAPLEGRVVLQNVRVDVPIEGRFSLKSEGGELFEGTFTAEWRDTVILCG